MRYFGLLLGAVAGLLVSRHWFGALVGGVVGWMVQAGWLRLGLPGRGAGGRDALMIAVFTLLGRLAKADGRVSEAEIAVCEQLLHRLALSADGRRVAIQAFNDGKRADADLSTAYVVLRQARRQAPLFLEVFIDMALADGAVHAEERRLLGKYAWMLGIRESALELMLARRGRRGGSVGGPAGGDPYAVLGIGGRASDNEVRRAFRKLISRHHPDKLAASGATPEAVRLAQEKTRDLIAAYERIKSARGMN